MDGWIQRDFFLSFLSPYCMCGPAFEVNIQCLLPILPAVSHASNFMLSQMRSHSNRHTKIAFSLLLESTEYCFEATAEYQILDKC